MSLTSWDAMLRELWNERWAEGLSHVYTDLLRDPPKLRIVALNRTTGEVTLDRHPMRARVRHDHECSNCGAPWTDPRQDFIPKRCFYCGSRPNEQRYSRIETAIRCGQTFTVPSARRLLELPE